MRESEYMLVSNLEKLNLATQALGGVLFGENDPRQKTVWAALKQLRKLTEKIYAELDGKIEEDPE